MDNYDPNWVWYTGGISLAMAIAGFYALHLRLGSRFAIEQSMTP